MRGLARLRSLPATSTLQEWLQLGSALSRSSASWMGRKLESARESATVSLYLCTTSRSQQHLISVRRAFSQETRKPDSMQSNLSEGRRVAVRRLFKRFPVAVGCSIKVNVTGETAVDVVVGQNAEEIIVQAEWFNPQARAENTERFLHVTATEDCVEVDESESDADGAQLEPQVIRVSVPERWCSVKVHTWGGAVSVDNVTEANLEVKTDGGDVKLGKVKGSRAEIDTNGGSLEAKAIYSTLRAATHGGHASFRQILGNDVSISTGRGDLVLEAMYGQRLKVVDCERLQMCTLSSEDAELRVGGGGVAIDGLDGNARIRSEGDVRLLLNENADTVEIYTEAGNVAMFLSSSVTAKVEYAGRGMFSHDRQGSSSEAVADPADPNSKSVVLEAHDLSGQRKAEAVDETSGRGVGPREERLCVVKVATENGSLVVKRRGWLEAAMEKAGYTLPVLASHDSKSQTV